MTGRPLDRVLTAVGTSSGSVAEVARAARLTPTETAAALDLLESVGRVRRVPLLGAACAPAGCASCVTAGCPLLRSPAAELRVWQVVAPRAPQPI